MLLNFEALEEYGAHANRGFLIQLTTPDIVTLTQNSDTPYGLGWGDAAGGPVVIEIPKGPLMGVVDDMNFQFVTNMGLVGDEAGAGAKYLFVPPGHVGDVADGYVVRQLLTNHFLTGSQWFAYFRMYGPTKPAFDGTWRPSDFKQN